MAKLHCYHRRSSKATCSLEESMRRRNFCKYLAAAAVAKALPSWPQTASDSQLPQGFNRYTQSYAAFCALPPEKRAFYKVVNRKIVETKLDESTWQPSAWNSS